MTAAGAEVSLPTVSKATLAARKKLETERASQTGLVRERDVSRHRVHTVTGGAARYWGE